MTKEEAIKSLLQIDCPENIRVEAESVLIQIAMQEQITWFVNDKGEGITFKNVKIPKVLQLCAVLNDEFCEDCISREALLNRLKDFTEWCQDGRLQGALFVSDVVADMPSVQPKGKAERNGKFYKDAILRESALRIVDSPRSRQQMVNMLEDMPSVQPESRWIPCSERLPEDKQSVLVWCPQYKNIYCAYLEKEQWWIFGAFVQIVPNEVIAWMPLPEQYKREE